MRFSPSAFIARMSCNGVSMEPAASRRENRQRCTLAFSEQNAIRRPDRRYRVVLCTGELLLLWMPAGVVPYDTRREPGCESAEASLIFVGHPRLVRLRDRLHAKQVA